MALSIAGSRRQFLGWSVVVLLGMIVAAGITFVYLQASQSTKAAPAIIDLQATGRASGLYRTGVSDSNTKLAAGVADPHWEISNVIWEPNGGVNPCQYASNATTWYKQPIRWRGTGVVTPAFTIDEFSGGRAGAVVLTDPWSTGNLPRGEPATNGVWGVTSSNARWIGQNRYGQNTHDSSCPDPSRYGYGDLSQSITYTFRLKNGFRIDDSVDPASIALRIGEGYFDNGVKIRVNGKQIPLYQINAYTGVPTTTPTYGWVTPGFHAGADRVVSSPVSGVFNTGSSPNTIEVLVGSTYSASAMLIGNITLNGSLKSNYELTPSVQNMPSAVELGEEIKAQLAISNSGPTPSVDETRREAKRFVLRPGEALRNETGGTTSTEDPCVFYGVPTGRCTNVLGDTGAIAPGGFTQESGVSTEGIGARPGDRVCFTMSVRPYASAAPSNQWKHSYQCTYIGVKPKVQVRGGDLSVGRAFSGVTSTTSTIRASTSLKPDGLYGSWSEYGAFAPSRIQTYATNAGLDGATSGAPTGQSDWSRLTFANSGTPSSCGAAFGCWATDMGRIPDVESVVTASGYTASSDSGAVIAGRIASACASSRRSVFEYTGTTPLELSVGNIGANCTIIVKTTRADIRLTQNITYQQAGYTSIAAIPQVVLLSNRNIMIDNNVTNIDAWLVAKETVDTCTSGGATRPQLTVSACNQPLVVNGPVMTKKLLLQRTGGSGTGRASGDPAETFNLRADAYLWAIGQSSGSGRAPTVYQRDLSPRF